MYLSLCGCVLQVCACAEMNAFETAVLFLACGQGQCQSELAHAERETAGERRSAGQAGHHLETQRGHVEKKKDGKTGSY